MKFVKTICIILVLLAIVSFAFSCSSEIADKFLSESEDEESSVSLSNTELIFESDTVEGTTTFNETTTVEDTTTVEETTIESTPPVLEENVYSDLTMVCLGDSITMGSEIETPYSDLVKDSLGLSAVHNYGVGWSTIGYMSDCTCHANVDYEYDHHPYIHRYHKMQDADIVAVMGGNNDWGIGIPVGDIYDIDETTFCGALNILIDGLKGKYPDSYIFFMTLFNYVPDRINKNGVSWVEYNNAIREICAIKGIDVFDVNDEIPFDKDRDTVDGVHPTQEFVTNVWAPAIADFIRENYKK